MLTHEITIRAYQETDWQAVSCIHDLARPIELEGSCDPRAFVPLAEDVDDLKEFSEARKLVACQQARVVGFVGIDGDDIGWLYVDPQLAGRGIGRCLVQQALGHIERPANVYVLKGNLRAISLYKSEGFHEVESFKSKNNGYPCTVLKMSRSDST